MVQCAMWLTLALIGTLRTMRLFTGFNRIHSIASSGLVFCTRWMACYCA